MKALALKPGTTNLHLKDVEEPKITTPTQVKVKVLEVGICGTDREEVKGGRADAPKGEEELIIGHEMLSKIVEVGKEVKEFKVGDLVVLTVRRGCGQCVPCKKDCYDMCETGNYTERGIKQRHGYETEFVVEEQKFVIPIPASIRSIAVLTEPTTVVEKAIQEACKIQESRIPLEGPYLKDRNVLVVGLGPIGLLATMVLRLRGAKVFGLDRAEENSLKAQVFKELGGTYFQGEQKSQDFFKEKCPQLDMVVEAAGVAKLDFDLIQLLGFNGIYVLTGVPGDERPLNVNGGQIMKQLVLKNQVLVGSVNASFENFKMAVKDLEEAEKKWKGVIPKIITSKTPYQEFEKALVQKPENEIKSIIVWSQE